MDIEPDKDEPAPRRFLWLQRTLSRVGYVSSLRERSRIRKICRETLELYRQIQTEMPDSSSKARYARLIEKGTGADVSTVQRVLRRAEESFATWPVERPLMLRDVVQYLAVTDSLKTDFAVNSVDSRLVDASFAIVTKAIPANL